MDSSKKLHQYILLVTTIIIGLSGRLAFATAYTYPGNATAPITLLNGDTLAVTSGTFTSTTNNFTVSGNSTATTSTTISSGATVSYTGTDSGNTFNLSQTSGTFTLNNSGTISVTTGNAINLAGSGGTLAVNLDGTGAAISGTVVGPSTGANLNMIFGGTSAVAFTTDGAMSNLNQFTVTNGTVTADDTIGLRNSGALSIGASGTLTLNESLSLGTSPTLSLTGNLNIASAFPSTGSTAFSTITGGGGTFYFIGDATLNSALSVTGTANLYVGQNSAGTANACDLTTAGAIANIVDIQVKNGSFTVNDAITGVTTGFSIAAGAEATLAAQLSGAGCTTTNNGTLTLSIASALNTSGTNPFTNAGNLNVNNVTFTPSTYSTFTNTNGNIYVYGISGAISSALASGNSLDIGADSSGTTYSATAFTTAATISNVTTINHYAGTFTQNHAISGNTTFNLEEATSSDNTVFASNATISTGTFTVGSGVTASIAAALTASSAVSNTGTLTLTSNITGNVTNNSGGTFTSNSSAGARTITGSFTNSGTLSIAGGANSTAIATGNVFTNETTGTVTIAASTGLTLSGTTTLINSNTITANGTLTVGTGAITNNSTGTITVPTGGTFAIGASAFSNAGTLSLTGTLSGTSTITNTGTITYNSGAAATATALNNSTGGTITIAGAATHTGAITNNATFNIGANLTAASGISNATGGNIYVYSTGSITTAPVITGSGTNTVNVGRNSSGTTYSSTTWSTSNAFTGISTFNIYAGSFTTTGGGTIGCTSFSVSESAAATIGAVLTATTLTNSGTFSQTATVTASGGVTNEDTGSYTITAATITGPLTNYGTLTATGSSTISGALANTGGSITAATLTTSSTTDNQANSTFTVSTAWTMNGQVNNQASATMSLTGTVSGTGSLINDGILALGAGTNSVAITNNSAGVINVTGALTKNTNAVTNSGTLNIAANYGGSGNLINNAGGAINISTSALTTDTGTIANAQNATLTFSGTVTNDKPIANAGNMYVTGTLTNSSTATLTNSATDLISISGSFVNNATTGTNNLGNITVTGSLSGTNVITNSGNFTSYGALSGGALTNNASGVLNFYDGTNNSKTITLSANGTFNVSGDVSSTTSLSNSGTMNLNGNLEVASGTLTNANILNVTGVSTLTANSYTNTGTHVVSINSATDVGSLACTGTVTLNNSTLTIDTDFVGDADVVYTWTLLSGTSVSATNLTINTPTSSFYRLFDVTVNADNITATSLYRVPSSGINADIANIINTMYNNPANADQQTIANAFGIYTADFNEDLHEMIPICNSSQVGMHVQQTIFTKAESRLAMLRNADYYSPKYYFAGDMVPNDSLWISTFGVLTNQHPDDTNDGYNAKTGVILAGFDKKIANDVVGLGVGYSYTRTQEYTSSGFINGTNSTYAMLYGTHYYRCCNYIDWLLSASYNRNHTNRAINVGGVNLSTHANFDDYNASVKLVRGKEFDFWNTYRLAPYASLQYSYLNQDSYNEEGSAAALHVAERTKSIVTVGVGTRFNFPLDCWRAIGMRELRAAVTYDVLNDNDTTIANFVAGSSTFNIVDTPARLGFQLGAGITFALGDCVQFLINYDFEWRQGFTEHIGLLKFRFIL